MNYLVVVPTYNEKENIARLTTEILKHSNIEILVVDDNSPDGTAQIVSELAKTESRVHLLLRNEKTGLGAAYRDGFKWALCNNYDYLISMDADFSHPPTALENMKELSVKNPGKIILGSRYVKGGKIIGWDIKRYLNSYIANFFVRAMLFLTPHDATAGFKAYPIEFIRSLNLDKLVASGYAFQVEMLFLAKQNNFPVLEFPIIFRDRESGESKISGELMRSAKIVWQLFLRQKTIVNFIKFCIVGLTCTLIDWAIFFLLKLIFHIDLQSEKQIIKAVSFAGSATVSYILNRNWTFHSEAKNIGAEATKFFSMAIVGLALNNVFFFIFGGLLGFMDILALICATAIVLFWNFTISRLWVFKK